MFSLYGRNFSPKGHGWSERRSHVFPKKKKPFPHLSNMFADSVTNCQCLSTKQSVKGHPSLEKACNILQNVKTTKIVFIIQREDKFLFY